MCLQRNLKRSSKILAPFLGGLGKSSWAGFSDRVLRSATNAATVVQERATSKVTKR